MASLIDHIAIITPIRLCLAARSRAEVDAFYGAFVLDPDGHNVETVFHE